jgi:mRNA deadenylase 3'-5' endonuclease subunit Ccr4
LQEVQANHFEKFFHPQLVARGYEGIYKRKTRDSHGEDPDAIDGCALFYRRDRFALLEQYGIEFVSGAAHTPSPFTTTTIIVFFSATHQPDDSHQLLII